MIKCIKVRPFLPAVAAGNFEMREGPAIQQHLEGCPECRATMEKSRRLHALLGLKRHEQPDEFYFRTFLAEFHRRLMSDMVHKPSIWAWIRQAIPFGREPGVALLRLSYVAALGVILLSLYTAHISMESNTPQHFARRQQARPNLNRLAAARSSVVEVDSAFNHLVMAQQKPAGKTVYVLDRVAYEPSKHGPQVLEF